MANRTTIERKSERELVVTRTFDGPARLVFEAWTTPELMKRWWAPKASDFPLLSCEMDVRTGGGYRLEFGNSEHSMAFFGKYLDVIPLERLVWTNDESADASVTTVTFEDRDGQTLLVLSELYPSKAACDEALAGAREGFPEYEGIPEFEQLDELLTALGASAS